MKCPGFILVFLSFSPLQVKGFIVFYHHSGNDFITHSLQNIAQLASSLLKQENKKQIAHILFIQIFSSKISNPLNYIDYQEYQSQIINLFWHL